MAVHDHIFHEWVVFHSTHTKKHSYTEKSGNCLEVEYVLNGLANNLHASKGDIYIQMHIISYILLDTKSSKKGRSILLGINRIVLTHSACS